MSTDNTWLMHGRDHLIVVDNLLGHRDASSLLPIPARPRIRVWSPGLDYAKLEHDFLAHAETYERRQRLGADLTNHMPHSAASVLALEGLTLMFEGDHLTSERSRVGP